MKEKLEILKSKYENYFSRLGYQENQPVKITSGIDRSVVFVGSTISVLKPKLLSNDIDNVGDFLVQRAIRTRCLKRMNIPEKNEWSSYFDASGILVKYNNLDKLVYDIINFLSKELQIEENDLMIRISKNDIDLINSLKNIDYRINIEYNTRPEQYYIHKYGLQNVGIYGRNFNIAIKDKLDNNYKDIGNVIVIESDEKKYGVECAIGLNSVVMRESGLKTSIDASSIVDIFKPNNPGDYKFADCLTVVSHLAYENVSSIEERSPNYLYRKYLKYLFYWGKVLNISKDNINELIKKYILLEYNEYNDIIIKDNIDKVLLKSKGGFKYEK